MSLSPSLRAAAGFIGGSILMSVSAIAFARDVEMAENFVIWAILLAIVAAGFTLYAQVRYQEISS